MRIDEATGHVILGRRDCRVCSGAGERLARHNCPTCKGTGSGPRGGKGNCRPCFGLGHACGPGKVPCGACNGMPEAAELESTCDTIPKDWVERFRFHVIRAERPMPMLDSLLGAGFGSCTDYGDAWKSDNAAIIWKVREQFTNGYLQLTKFARPLYQVPKVDWAAVRDLPHEERVAFYAEQDLAEHSVPQVPTWDVGIVVYPNGYSIVPVWPEQMERLGLNVEAAA